MDNTGASAGSMEILVDSMEVSVGSMEILVGSMGILAGHASSGVLKALEIKKNIFTRKPGCLLSFPSLTPQVHPSSIEVCFCSLKRCRILRSGSS